MNAGIKARATAPRELIAYFRSGQQFQARHPAGQRPQHGFRLHLRQRGTDAVVVGVRGASGA